MVLEGAEVEHLVALAEVDGPQVAGGAPADEPAVGAGAGVVAAERRPGSRGRWPPGPTWVTWVAICQTCVGPRSCTAMWRTRRRSADVELGDGAEKPLTSAAEPCHSTTVDLAVVAGAHDEPGEGRQRRRSRSSRSRPAGRSTVRPAGTSITIGPAAAASFMTPKTSTGLGHATPSTCSACVDVGGARRTATPARPTSASSSARTTTPSHDRPRRRPARRGRRARPPSSAGSVVGGRRGISRRRQAVPVEIELGRPGCSATPPRRSTGARLAARAAAADGAGDRGATSGPGRAAASSGMRSFSMIRRRIGGHDGCRRRRAMEYTLPP